MKDSMLIRIVVLVVSLCGAFQAFGQAEPPRYKVTDLGDLGGVESVATSINTKGQIVGASWLAGHTPATYACDERRAFLYEDGVMVELPSLPGTRFAIASAINDQGDVSGTNDVYTAGPGCTDACFPGSCEAQTPVLIEGGLGVLNLSAPLPWYAGVANDVNKARQVVGWSRRADLFNPRTWHGYLWQNGVRTDLGTIGDDWSIAAALNDAGLVVGYLQLHPGSNVYYGFRWRGGVMTQLPVLDANTNNGANDVDASGDAVGWSGPNTSEARPVYYPTSGGVRDLGTLGGTEGSAFGLNDRGSVVGYSYTSGNQKRHAILYRDDLLWDLNDLIVPGGDWELIAATDVNDVGEIVGYGCHQSTAVPPASCVDGGGGPVFRRAFLLTPVTSLSDLEDLIRSFDLPHGLENSLLAKIAAARRAHDAGRDQTACNLLGSLRNEVEAQSGGGLTTEDADLILETLRLVEAEIGCG